VVLVMGKGGVGKTTIAAGLAVLEAETRGVAVLVEFGDGESGRRALHGSGGRRDVEHVVIRPDDAVARGATPLFGSATLAKLALGNFAMRPLIRAAPAVRELAMLESVRQVMATRPGARVVVDMPATGHSVAWLRVPRQGRELLGEGPLFEMCDRLGRELLAPGRSSIVVVTLPERLVLEETIELCAAVDREAGLSVDRIVVNRLPIPFSAEALADARALAAGGGPLAGHASVLASILAARAAARAECQGALDLLGRTRHAVWQVPLAPVDPSARDVARWLRAEGAG
jgi:arsenite-transporting ATPase